MKILIFGVTGNCGTYCAKKFLKKNWTIFGVGRSETKISDPNMFFIKGDIRDDALYKKLPTDVDLVINFAGVQPSTLTTSENTDLAATLNSYVDVNINGVFKILEFVRKNKIANYIYTLSHRDYEEYWSNNVLLKNDLPPAINYKGDHTMYAITETTAKMIGDYFGNVFGTRVFNLRLPSLFFISEAPYYLKDGRPTLKPFLKIIHDAMEGKSLQIWGDPNMARDYVHIDNLASLIELCFNSSLNGGTFNVGTGEAVTTENFIKSIGKVFSNDPENMKYEYRPDNKTYKCASCDITQQKQLLGYKPVFLQGMLERLKKDIEDGGYMQKWGWN